MTRRGRPPSPNSRASRAGKYRTLTVPDMPLHLAVPPAVMSKPAAFEYWNQHAPALVADGRLTPASVEPFATLCRYHAEVIEHQAELDKEGAIIQNFRGQPIGNPRVQILLRVRRDFVSLARDFGLTPASYAKLPTQKKAEDDEAQREEALLRTFTG